MNNNRIFIFLIFMLGSLAGSFGSPCLAESPKVAVMSGFSSPAPGISGEGILCQLVTRSTCLGGSYAVSRNELLDDNTTIVSQHVVAVLEQDIPWGDEYHFIWLLGQAGAGVLQRSAASLDGETKKAQWGPSLGFGFGGEFPIADLFGLRIGISAKKVIAHGSPTEIGLVGGVRFGSEWLGFGR